MYLKVVIALKVFAWFQKTGIELYWLGAWITFHPEENMFLYFIEFDVCTVYNHIVQSHLPNLFNFCFCEDSVYKININRELYYEMCGDRGIGII
jgi:hypothetical protein